MKINEQRLNECINRLKAFIVEVRQGESAPPPENPERLTFFTVEDRGGLTMWGESQARYLECLEKLDICINGDPQKRKPQSLPSQHLSLKRIEEYVNEAVLTALNIDPEGGRVAQEEDSVFEERLTATLRELKARLSTAPARWDVYLHILGVHLEHRCFSFGGVRFLPCDKEGRRLLRRESTRFVLLSAEPPASKKQWIQFQRQIIRDSLPGGVLTYVQVEALDEAAAFSTAKEIVTRTMEVLNFYSLTLHPSSTRAHIFFAGEAQAFTRSVGFAASEQKFQLHLTMNTPQMLFDISQLTGPLALDNGLPKLSAILRGSTTGTMGTFQRRLLGAFRFAGRAMIEKVREEAFLHHAVALECLLGDTDAGGEITYKLATRCAHILGADADARKEIQQRVKEFYGMRSKIVHRGDDTVTQAQLNEFSQYVRRTLLVVLTAPAFASVTDEAEFLKLLEERVLA